MERIQSTIEHLRNEKPIISERVAVLVCPPLTKKRFDKKKDFVREISRRFTWEQYKKEIGIPVSKQLLEMEEDFSVVVIPDVKFSYFKKILQSRDYDVIFIVAHHIGPKEDNIKNKKGHNPVDEIEFADGGVQTEKMRTFLSNVNIEETKMSLVFMICKGSELQENCYNLSAISSVASVFWNLDFLNGVVFIKYWTRFLNGKNTLSQAYHLAIDEFINLDLEEGEAS